MRESTSLKIWSWVFLALGALVAFGDAPSEIGLMIIVQCAVFHVGGRIAKLIEGE